MGQPGAIGGSCAPGDTENAIRQFLRSVALHSLKKGIGARAEPAVRITGFAHPGDAGLDDGDRGCGDTFTSAGAA